MRRELYSLVFVGAGSLFQLSVMDRTQCDAECFAACVEMCTEKVNHIPQ